MRRSSKDVIGHCLPRLILLVCMLVVAMGNSTEALAAEEPPADCASNVADQQGVTAFVSLIDGQPTDPKTPTLNVTVSRQSGAVSFQPALQLALGNRRGLCDAVLSVQLPPLTISNGHTILNQLVGVSWEQRWQEDTGRRPTLATMLTAILDHSGPSTQTTVEGMVIVAKTFRQTVFYANVGLSATFGNGGPRAVTPSLALGGKWPARGDKALIADIVLTKGAPATVEFGYQFSGPFDIDFGPGVSVSLDKQPSVGFGLVIQREF